MNYEQTIRTAIRAAYQAGEILNNHFGRLKQIDKKGEIDLVTEADVASERSIINTIAAAFPDHSILAEESGRIDRSSQVCWIIDPLDGTTNFAHQLPLFCISIALAVNDQVVAGIVFNPRNAELFTAVKGQGAFLNNKAISVSAAQHLSDSLLATGFPYDVRDRLEATTTRLALCLNAARGVRRLGSAALDLCYVACGRFDGFWEENLKPWDIAAGALIVEEAGGRVSDFTDAPFNIRQKETLATNNRVHNAMIRLLRIKDGNDKPNAASDACF